jgi:hypothetical protein
MSLKYEPSSDPLHISAKQMMIIRLEQTWQDVVMEMQGVRKQLGKEAGGPPAFAQTVSLG